MRVVEASVPNSRSCRGFLSYFAQGPVAILAGRKQLRDQSAFAILGEPRCRSFAGAPLFQVLDGYTISIHCRAYPCMNRTRAAH
jgi:hypothetical protein